MSARLKDIAQETGFAINTVSLALKNSPRISIETRQVIHEAAKRLDYIPNKVARSLATQKSDLIAFVVGRYNNFIHNEIASAFEQKLSDLGYNMLLATTQRAGGLQTLKVLEEQRVAGIFMFPSLPPDMRQMEYIRRSETPIMLLSYGSDYELPTDAVYVDREQAAYIVIKHLLDHGHRRIGFICSSHNSDQPQFDRERFRGYVSALKERGIDYDPAYSIVTSDCNFSDGYNAAEILFHRTNVTAIFGANDFLACGAMKYYLSHGIRVPEQVSFASNDSTDIAAYAPVALTASAYPILNLRDTAVNLMMERISGRATHPHQRIAIKSTLDVRLSTGPCCEGGV